MLTKKTVTITMTSTVEFTVKVGGVPSEEEAARLADEVMKDNREYIESELFDAREVMSYDITDTDPKEPTKLTVVRGDS